MSQRSKDACEIMSRKHLSGTASVSMTLRASPTRGAITDRAIDTIYQLLYRFLFQKTSFQADVLSMRVHFSFKWDGHIRDIEFPTK